MKRFIIKSKTFSGYKLQGRTECHGMKISIENKKGSYRKGTDSDGHEWKMFMNFDYGYIRETTGKDKDHLDCYIGPNKESDLVYIVHQLDPMNGNYDEDKVMLAFSSKDEATRGYLKQYDRPGFLGPITTMRIEDFKKKIYSPEFQGRMIKSRLIIKSNLEGEK